MEPINQSIINILELTDSMLKLGNRGIEEQADDNCGILFCVLRDYAFSLKQMAEKELGQHQAAGLFNEKDVLILNEYRKKSVSGKLNYQNIDPEKEIN
jgi:hypothetical protein